MKKKNHQLYRKSGAQIAEVPFALFIIFFLLFFPMLDLLCLFFSWTAGWYLNQIELREVACSPPYNSPPTTKGDASQGTAESDLVWFTVNNLSNSTNWKGYMGVTETSPPQVAQQYASNICGSNTNLTGKSWVKTSVNIQPLLPVPFFPNVPGLTKPVHIVYENSIMQEELGLP